MAERHICFAIYTSHAQADEAFSRLEVEGFNMDLLSVVSRDYWIHMTGSFQSNGSFAHRGKAGAFWDRLWAKLPGWGVFYYFETGPMLVAGLLANTLTANLGQDGKRKSTGQDVDDLQVGLLGIGIPADSVRQYHAALLSDQVLLFVFGAFPDVDHAQRLLNETKAINHTLHHIASDFHAGEELAESRLASAGMKANGPWLGADRIEQRPRPSSQPERRGVPAHFGDISGNPAGARKEGPQHGIHG